jgi:hypothetical protein
MTRVLRAAPPPPAEPAQDDPTEAEDPEVAAIDAASARLRNARDPQEARAALIELEAVAGPHMDDQALGKIWGVLHPPSKSESARNALNEHLAWIDANLSEPADKARAVSHALSTHVDDLDPIQDRATIEAAEELFRTTNPTERTTRNG